MRRGQDSEGGRAVGRSREAPLCVFPQSQAAASQHAVALASARAAPRRLRPRSASCKQCTSPPARLDDARVVHRKQLPEHLHLHHLADRGQARGDHGGGERRRGCRVGWMGGQQETLVVFLFCLRAALWQQWQDPGVNSLKRDCRQRSRERSQPKSMAGSAASGGGACGQRRTGARAGARHAHDALRLHDNRHARHDGHVVDEAWRGRGGAGREERGRARGASECAGQLRRAAALPAAPLPRRPRRLRRRPCPAPAGGTAAPRVRLTHRRGAWGACR